MKKTAILVLTVSAVLLCGCDFFRGLAGRPTSAEIAGRREAVELAARAREQARLDSVRVEEETVRDSVAAISRIDSLGIQVISLSGLGGAENMLSAGYAIVVGSFKSIRNAEGMAQEISKDGYSPLILTFKNGMSSVVLEPRDRICDAVEVYEKVRNEKFCPKDAWILRND